MGVDLGCDGTAAGRDNASGLCKGAAPGKENIHRVKEMLKKTIKIYREKNKQIQIKKEKDAQRPLEITCHKYNGAREGRTKTRNYLSQMAVGLW